MRLFAFIALSFIATDGLTASTHSPHQGAVLFSLKVYPLLSSKCFACHGKDPKKIKGELDLTSREGLLMGGESEQPSIVPGKPMLSPLYLAAARDQRAAPL